METWIMLEGQWMHIAITFDGEKKKTYINGELWSIQNREKTEHTKELSANEISDIYNKGVGKSNAL